MFVNILGVVVNVYFRLSNDMIDLCIEWKYLVLIMNKYFVIIENIFLDL